MRPNRPIPKPQHMSIMYAEKSSVTDVEVCSVLTSEKLCPLFLYAHDFWLNLHENLQFILSDPRQRAKNSFVT